MPMVQYFFLLASVAALLRAKQEELRVWQWTMVAAGLVWGLIERIIEVLMYGY